MAAGPSLDDRDPRGARRSGGGASKRITRPAARRGGGGGDRPKWQRYVLLAVKLGMVGLFAAIAVVVFMFGVCAGTAEPSYIEELGCFCAGLATDGFGSP